MATSPWLGNLIGSVAAFCTTVSFVPQLIRVWKLKSARDISLIMFSVFSAGVFLWLIYGLMIRSFPVIFSNLVTLLLSLAILALKRRYDRQSLPGARRERIS